MTPPEAVDSVATKVRTLYESLSEEERPVLELMLAEAAQLSDRDVTGHAQTGRGVRLSLRRQDTYELVMRWPLPPAGPVPIPYPNVDKHQPRT